MNWLTTDRTALEQSRRQLNELQAFSVDVCALLRDLSRDLFETDSPPTEKSIDNLARFRSAFDCVQASLPRTTTSDPQAATDNSLTALREDLELQSLIQTALERLHSLATIRHVEQREFEPWQHCLVDGTNLRDELFSAPVAQVRVIAERFLSPQSPLNAIVTLVCDGPELADEQWSRLLDSVSAAYGREVSTAIARRKLVLTTALRA